MKRKDLPVLTPNKNRPFRAILRNISHHSSRFYVEVMMQYFSEVHFENWLCIHVNDYCEFCQISMNIFSYRAPPVAASWMRILVPFLHFGTTTSLTHFSPVSHFYTSWKPKVFWHWTKMGQQLNSVSWIESPISGIFLGSSLKAPNKESANIHLFITYF